MLVKVQLGINYNMKNMKKLFTFSSLFFLSTVFLSAQTTYKDVAGIFYSRCTSCHHDGASQYPLMNYSQVNANKAMISFNLTNNVMPPWTADTSYTRFQHERLITLAEKNKILSWISNGTTKGDTSLAPAPPTYPVKYQLGGNADLTLSIPTFTSNATANDIYVCFSIPSGLTQDRIIRAFEVVPGNAPIVHHAVITADTTGQYQSNLSGSCFNIPGNLEIGTYAPGTRATVFPGKAPLKTGIRLKAGSKVIMQLHYPKGSVGQVDSTKIRLYFYPVNEPNVRQITVATPLQNWNLFIPANTTQTFTAYYPSQAVGLAAPLSVFGIFPHSHVICESIVNYALNPGIDTIKLIRINNWDFHWQDYYSYKKLVKIPSGYRLFAKHVYNNTTSNPNNPSSPPINVLAGTSTLNEMLFDGLMYLPYQTGDELIDLEAIINSDPLLGLEEKKIVDNIRASAFPNPFNNSVSIHYLINNTSDVTIEISDLLGKKIFASREGKKETGVHEFIWNANSLIAGVYFYKISAGSLQYEGKIIKQNN